MIEMYVRLITGMDTWTIDRVPAAWKEPVLAELKARGYDGNGDKLPAVDPQPAEEPTPEPEAPAEEPTPAPTEEPPATGGA